MEEENYAYFRYSYEELVKQIDEHLSRYSFSKLESYDGNLLNKLRTLLKNYPKYMRNKKKLKVASYDYSVYYHGEDLKYFIKYINRCNSVRLALDLIFNNCHLSNEEVEYLFNHDKCINWVSEYCNLTAYDLSNSKKLVRTKRN